MAEDSDDSKACKPPHEVGYDNPAKRTQFQPGKSGNPGGRPVGSKRHEQDISALLNQTVPVKLGRGKAKNVAMFEHNLRRLVVLAIKEKKLDAILEFLRLCEHHGVLVRPEALALGGNVTFPKNEDYAAFCEWMDHHRLLGENTYPWRVVRRDGRNWIERVKDDEHE